MSELSHIWKQTSKICASLHLKHVVQKLLRVLYDIVTQAWLSAEQNELLTTYSHNQINCATNSINPSLDPTPWGKEQPLPTSGSTPSVRLYVSHCPYLKRMPLPSTILQSPLVNACIYQSFSERERSRSLPVYVIVMSSVTFVRPTQATEIFGNVSTPFGRLATCDLSTKILRRSSRGNPSVGG